MTGSSLSHPVCDGHSQTACSANQYVGSIGAEEVGGAVGDDVAGGEERVCGVTELEEDFADVFSGGESADGLSHAFQGEYFCWRWLYVMRINEN